MFEWLKRIQDGANSAEETMRYFGQMLEDGRHVFDLAAGALLGGTDPETIKSDVWDTDKRINRNERRIRRRLVTHLTAYGSYGAAGHLVMMSLVKDAERIGDYSKNLFDLAVLDRGVPAEVLDDMLDLRETLSRMLSKARNVHETEDEEAARAFVARAEKISKRCDVRIAEMVLRDDTDNRSATGALAYRYFKRINAHAMNVITSILVPVDRLDYWDEDDADNTAAGDTDFSSEEKL